MDQLRRNAADSAVLVTSAPLGWPDIVVEQRIFTGPARLEEPFGEPCHRILIWDEAMDQDLTIGDRTFGMHRPDGGMAILPAATPVAIGPEPGQRYLCLSVTPFCTKAVASDLGLPPETRILPFAGVADFAIAAMGRMLFDAATGHRPLDLPMIAVIVRELAVRLLHGYSDQRFDAPSTAGKLTPAALIRVLNLIADRIGGPLTVAQMAREAGVSRSHFSRAFAASVGRAPHEYLMSRRVAKAAHLLRQSDLALDRIAAECGFHDQAHMTRQFRSRMDTTPRAWRLARQDLDG